MKIEIKYSGGILNLPSCVADIAPFANEAQLKLLLSLAGAPQYFSDIEPYMTTLTQKLELTVAEIKNAIAFWVAKGVLIAEGIDSEIENAIADENASMNREPTYTGKQIQTYMENHKDFKSLCDECQKILNKLFITNDINNVRLLKEYFKFSDEYILLLLTHCAEIKKTSWDYIRRMAHNLCDLDITTYSALDAHFAARTNKRSKEYKIRTLLQIGQREFTASEKKNIENWISQKITMDLIKKAYEITVDKTGKISCNYMAKILDNWHANGFKTIEDVESSLEQYQNKQKMIESTFDTDDFFEAALERSNRKMMERRKK